MGRTRQVYGTYGTVRDVARGAVRAQYVRPILGRKRWFIYPPHWFHPALRLDPTRSGYALDGLAWFKSAYPAVEGTALAPAECVTATGDVLYLPEHWMHATLNTVANVGVAVAHLPARCTLMHV